MFGRKQVAALVAEFIGTAVLTLMVLSVQRSNIGVAFFVAAAAGLTVVLMSFAVSGASKAHFNPAITLGFWTARKIETVTAIFYIAAQMLGGVAAYYLYTYYVNNSLQSIAGKFSWHIFVAEAVGTAIFAFGFASAVYQGFSRAVTASFVGLSLMIGIVSASAASLGLLNPALALGVRAWSVTYVLAPVVGAIVGINLYSQLFAESTKKTVSTATVTSTTKKSSAKKKSTKK